MSFVSIPQAAEILNLSPATIRSRIKNGEWPHYPFGKRSIRLDIDEIRDMARLDAKGKPNGKRHRESQSGQ